MLPTHSNTSYLFLAEARAPVPGPVEPCFIWGIFLFSPLLFFLLAFSFVHPLIFLVFDSLFPLFFLLPW